MLAGGIVPALLGAAGKSRREDREDVMVFHGATLRQQGRLPGRNGRLATVAAPGATAADARELACPVTAQPAGSGTGSLGYRRDIAKLRVEGA